MMKYKKQNHFIIPWNGNKRSEVDFLLNYDMFINDIENKKYIIEPFSGTSAISFYIWLKYGNKFEYYINDNDNMLNLLYKCIISGDIFKIIDIINDKIKDIKSKDDYLNIVNIAKNIKDSYIPQNYFYEDCKIILSAYIIGHKYYTLRPFIYPSSKADKCFKKFILNDLQLKFIEFLQCDYVHFSNNDYSLLFEEYKNNEYSLFVFDPPYLDSCNNFYNCKSTTNIYEQFNNYKSEGLILKSSIYFILENSWIIKLLFQKCQSFIYDKKYNLTKKKTSHIIIKFN